METINGLAAGVAHEFNNVLQIIQGYLSFARNQLPPDSEIRRDLDAAMAASDRAADLSRRLLQFARSEFDEGDLTDVNDAIDSLRLLLRPIIGENIRLEFDASTHVPVVASSDATFRQAMLNLCINARDAMPSGGVLTVQAAALSAPSADNLAVGELSPSNYVKISVIDTGEGIPAENLPHIFDLFFSSKSPGKGTGLGLAMVATFVESAGGAIGVTSQPGEGSRFDLYLPVAVDAEGDGIESLDEAGFTAPLLVTP
ncbi:Wide host range VirA protein [Botrimarina colliarenosi]|uniref:histidine kinase n=2 Tax=Botrimarina colliarenosi TaxID=2528001 RepID=A0A5C6AMX0_9BACT|nr:Wide host range VirA protein [Botrimarina colliarenosi]